MEDSGISRTIPDLRQYLIAADSLGTSTEMGF
jgi:hypothetical protein